MFSSFAGIEVFFLICALIGGVFMLIRLVLQFTGGDGSSDMDAHIDASADVEAHHADSDVGFKFLSLHGLTAFFLMFGLVGLAMHRQSGAAVVVSIIAALAAGFGSVWVIGKLFTAVGRLQSSGTVAIESTVGCFGDVYLTIPQGGIGKVMVDVKKRLREYSAAAQNGEEIKTGIHIKVVGIKGDILLVEKSE